MIVLEGLYSGWALRLVESCSRRNGGPARIVYVAHNHEETTRAAVARDYRGNPAVGLALHYDARKARWLERALVERADVVTAITPEDAARFAASPRHGSIVVLSPGYAGPRVPRRAITDAVPKRVVLVGSFAWLAKRMNLHDFVAVADPVFAEAGVEFQVIGEGAAEAVGELRPKLRATSFVGKVPEIESYLADARLALVPERTGGGFKLKILDYVFNRLPLAAIEGSMAGVPLEAPKTHLTFATFAELAHGAVQAANDIPLLNRLQESAYEACAPKFDWRERGKRFVTEIAAA